MADWSLLPDDLIGNILSKSESPKDFVRFSMVCHAWNRVSSMVKPKWISDNINTPWLLLAEPNKNNSQENQRKIFSIGENKHYEYRLPETFGARCWGSSYGWIVMLHLNKQINLFNPITKTQLSLPPLLTMPMLYDFSDDEEWVQDDKWFQIAFVRKFIVLKLTQKYNNINEDDFVVMVIHWPRDHLAFARPGDQAWTQVLTTCQKPYHVCHVYCYNGLVMILYHDGALATCDVGKTRNGNLAPKPVEAKDYLPAPPSMFKNGMIGNVEMYMVEIGSNLLVVARAMRDSVDENEKASFHTINFEIHKLDHETKVWERVHDLGNYLLFVGNNTALCVHRSNAPLCRWNAIYFTDDENDGWDGMETRGDDMGVFDLTSREITTFYKGDDVNSKCSTPVWFIPKF